MLITRKKVLIKKKRRNEKKGIRINRRREKMSGSKNSKRDTKMRTGQREESIAKRIPKR